MSLYLKEKKISIGFSLCRGNGGPTTFMRRLRNSIRDNGLAKTKLFINPFTDINVYANAIRNPWRRPYVIRVDGIAFDSSIGSEEISLRNSSIFFGMKYANGVIFQSKFGYKLITSNGGVVPKNFTIIPNGINLNLFNPKGYNYRDSLSIPSGDLVFITSAKWRAHKRLDSILKTFARFQDEYLKPSHLIILGELDAQKYEFSKNVHFIGHVPPVDLPAWYRTANLYIFLSWLDNCPNTVVEALGCGLPVVCTNQGGTKELIELTSGGIIIDADKPFKFKPVDLYNPPQPDLEKVLRGLLEAVNSLDALSMSINREEVDINTIAKRYVEFLGKVRSRHEFI